MSKTEQNWKTSLRRTKFLIKEVKRLMKKKKTLMMHGQTQIKLFKVFRFNFIVVLGFSIPLCKRRGILI